MNEMEIMITLDKFYGKIMTLEQGIEAVGRIVFTAETLEEEGNKFDMNELIREIGDQVLNEQ
jgi:hypothetical protein